MQEVKSSSGRQAPHIIYQPDEHWYSEYGCMVVNG